MLKTLVAIAGATFIISASATTARADEWDKKTIITVGENLLIPGGTLPPGKYVMKLLNSSSNRHIVQIFNEDQNKLEATILAFNNYRLERTADTVLQFWETPAGSPPALRAWFFPGDNYGQEFAYPRQMADLLARENKNVKVPSYETAASTPDAQQLAQLEVRDVDATPAPVQQTQARPAQPPPTEIAVAPPVVQPVPVAEVPAPGPANTVLAQNAPVPTPVTSPYDDDVRAEELPRTATDMPLLLGIGLLALASAIGVRAMKRT
ncbi:MAG: hypothetical protein ABIR70_21455 [Bryobacteraceae bacterium]